MVRRNPRAHLLLRGLLFFLREDLYLDLIVVFLALVVVGDLAAVRRTELLWTCCWRIHPVTWRQVFYSLPDMSRLLEMLWIARVLVSCPR